MGVTGYVHLILLLQSHPLVHGYSLLESLGGCPVCCVDPRTYIVVILMAILTHSYTGLIA